MEAAGRSAKACGGFPRPVRCTNHARVWQHEFEREHVFAHGPVAHELVPEARMAAMPPMVELAPGSTEKKLAATAQMLIELFVGHARLHRGIEIARADLQDPVHVREIEAHSAS